MARLVFCNFSVCWWKWWLQSLSIKGGRNPQKISSMPWVFSVSGGNIQVTTLGQRFSHGLMLWCGWNCCLSSQHSWNNSAPSEGVNAFRLPVNVPVLSLRWIFTAEPLYKGGHWQDKKHSQNLPLIGLFPYRIQHLAIASCDGCAHPLHLGISVDCLSH